MHCQHLTSIGYAQFSRRLHEKAARERVPLTGSIDLTERCNLRCIHCYINRPAGDGEAMEAELTRGELFGLIDQLAEAGCLWLLLTGGEPLVRTDFIDIYRRAKQKGMLITLFSNGTTVTPRVADFLAEYRPFAVEITLYGRTRQTYENVTRVPGSHAKCLEGIELLLERGLPVEIKTMVLTTNRHELDEMKAFAESLGARFRFDAVLNPRLDGGRTPETVRLPPREVVELDLADDKRAQGFRQFMEDFCGPSPRPEYVYRCGAGQSVFHVDARGRLSSCLLSRVPSYDLRTGDFHQGWRVFLPEIRARRWSRDLPCKSCRLYALCDQCPGWAQLESGDPERPVDYLCRIAHLRAEAFGFRTAEDAERMAI